MNEVVHNGRLSRQQEPLMLRPCLGALAVRCRLGFFLFGAGLAQVASLYLLLEP